MQKPSTLIKDARTMSSRIEVFDSALTELDELRQQTRAQAMEIVQLRSALSDQHIVLHEERQRLAQRQAPRVTGLHRARAPPAGRGEAPSLGSCAYADDHCCSRSCVPMEQMASHRRRSPRQRRFPPVRSRESCLAVRRRPSGTCRARRRPCDSRSSPCSKTGSCGTRKAWTRWQHS